MTYENEEYLLQECDITDLDEECIAYCSALNKLMVLNETAKVVWDVLKDMDSKKIPCSHDVIFQELQDSFDISDEEEADIMEDIQTIFGDFVNEGFIQKI